jgi:4'-phosphopantetheinyl transferase EntD
MARPYAPRHHSGKKVARDADQFMARIVAKRLLEHLDVCGFVVMSGESTKPHSTP